MMAHVMTVLVVLLLIVNINSIVDGGYSDWSPWTSCTVPCGTGSLSRSRDCTNQAPQYGGSECVGDSTETQDCNNSCPVDGGYSDWTPWTSCTVSCGTGSLSRSRDCTNPVPQFGGSECVGDSTETQDCNNSCPVDGGYSDWTPWTSCTVSCGTGSLSRSRDCTNPAPQYGGSECVGDSTETQDCYNTCPVDGGYSDWTPWTSCTVSCGTGSLSRSRDCVNPAPQYGGSECVGDSTETQDCNNPCPGLQIRVNKTNILSQGMSLQNHYTVFPLYNNTLWKTQFEFVVWMGLL